MSGDDNAWFAALRAQQSAEVDRRLEVARAEAHAKGKEPFDLDRLEAIYDTTSDAGHELPRAQRQADLEHKYYLRHPQVMTIEALAALLSELDAHR